MVWQLYVLRANKQRHWRGRVREEKGMSEKKSVDLTAPENAAIPRKKRYLR